MGSCCWDIPAKLFHFQLKPYAYLSQLRTQNKRVTFNILTNIKKKKNQISSNRLEHKMTKYFNTHILQSLVGQLSAEHRDRYLNRSTAGRYVLYASSDPCKELHPRTVKRSLRNLFATNATPHECVVRIREEKFLYPKLDCLKMTAKPLGLKSAIENMLKSEERFLRMGTNSESSTSIINLDERARGGLNASYDPNMLIGESSSNIKVLHHNPTFFSHSCTFGTENRLKSCMDSLHAQILKKFEEKQVDVDEPSSAMNQMSMQEASSEVSSEENDIPEQLIHLINSLNNRWNEIRRHEEPSEIYVNVFELLWNALSYCMQIVRRFFFNRREEPGQGSIRSYMDRAHYASFILGPATDECIAILADRIVTIIKWAMNKELQPSEIADEPQ